MNNVSMNNADTVIRFIPLSRLDLSPDNVRKTPAGRAAFAELKASIAAHGLLENLVVRAIEPDAGPNPDQAPEGARRHSVIAGGRRLSALMELAREGMLSPDYPVPCRGDPKRRPGR